MILYFLKTGLCMGLLLLFYHLVLEKESMYRFNRFFLLGAMFFSLAVPFLVSPIQWQLTEKPKEVISLELENAGPAEILPYESTPLIEPHPTVVTQSKPWYLDNWFFILYSVVTIILVIRLIAQLLNFYKLIQNHPIKQQGNTHIVLLGKNTLPFTFFNYLFVSADSYHNGSIEPEIWEHELTHIKEKHSYDIILVEVMKVIFWFNPFVYFYKKAIQLNHEFLADRAVTATFINIPQYQNLLIDKATGNHGVFRLSSPINYTITKKRLKMMYKQTSSGKSTLVKFSLLPILFLMTGLFGTAAHQDNDPSSTTSLPVNGSLITQYEYYINEALNVQKPSILLLEKLDIDGLKQVYQQMSPEEKEAVSYFPFLEDEETVGSLKLLQGLPDPYTVEFVFSSPPAKKSIPLEVWSTWKEVPTIEVEIDGTKYPQAKLVEFSPTDFSLYTAREEKDLVKGTVLQVSLSTHNYYYEKYVKVIKRVIGVRANYLENTQIDIPYNFIIINTPEFSFDQTTPENLPLSILEVLINPVKKRKNFIDLNKDKGFLISVIEGNSKKSQYVITN